MIENFDALKKAQEIRQKELRDKMGNLWKDEQRLRSSFYAIRDLREVRRRQGEIRDQLHQNMGNSKHFTPVGSVSVG